MKYFEILIDGNKVFSRWDYSISCFHKIRETDLCKENFLKHFNNILKILIFWLFHLSKLSWYQYFIDGNGF